jgi:hypothetical protein
MAGFVEGLNRINGQTLMIYASMLGALVAEARAGRLIISPRRIMTVAEPLLPEVRSAAQDVWGAPIANSWGTSEGGIVARGCYTGTGMHLSDDLVIVEPVDKSGQPVPRGSESAKVYLTNLFNPVLLLIRSSTRCGRPSPARTYCSVPAARLTQNTSRTHCRPDSHKQGYHTLWSRPESSSTSPEPEPGNSSGLCPFGLTALTVPKEAGGAGVRPGAET